MSLPKLPWFRCYSEIRHDPKVMTLEPAERWLWVALMAMASDSPERGVLLISDNMPARVADIAFEARVPEEMVEKCLAYFLERDMLKQRPDGAYWLPKFQKRQFASDNSRERVARHRAKRAKEQLFPDQEPCNADVTVEERACDSECNDSASVNSKSLLTENREQITEEKISFGAEAPMKRRSDPIFDAICQVTNTDPHKLTAPGRGPINLACKQLKAVRASPEEIRQRAAEFRRRWPTLTLTAPALVKHWASLQPTHPPRQVVYT